MQHGQPPSDSGPHAGKIALRDQLLTARNRRGLLEIGTASRALAERLLATPEVRRAATVAAYVSLGTEPGTSWLLEGLAAAGKRVLLPVLRPDRDLDWAAYAGADSLAPARLGLLEPAEALAPRLGRDAVATADVVLVPGLAVSAGGLRIGRGGGSYDRALGRVPVGTPVWCLLYDDELGRDVPAEAHDRPVTGAVSPERFVAF